MLTFLISLIKSLEKNNKINVIFPRGGSLEKKIKNLQNKNIFLISHKDELVSRVNSVLKVVKENGFTNYANDVEIIV